MQLTPRRAAILLFLGTICLALKFSVLGSEMLHRGMTWWVVAVMAGLIGYLLAARAGTTSSTEE